MKPSLTEDNKKVRLKFCLSMLDKISLPHEQKFMNMDNIVTKEPARRSSINRPAGTLETKVMTSVNRENVKEFLIHKVLPQIREKWPSGNMEVIFIQQDNARTHVDPMDTEFCEAAQEGGLEKENKLPEQIDCDPDIVNETIQYLN